MTEDDKKGQQSFEFPDSHVAASDKKPSPAVDQNARKSGSDGLASSARTQRQTPARAEHSVGSTTPVATTGAAAQPNPVVGRSKTKAERPLELALRLKLEESRERSVRHLVWGLIGLFLLAAAGFYGLERYMSSRIDIEESYAKVNDLITAAYRSDPEAHAEVVERFPELTQGRLPKNYSQLKQRPVLPDARNNAPRTVPGESSTRVPAPQPAEVVIPPLPTLDVFSDRRSTPLVIRRITDPSEVLDVEQDGDWVALSLKPAPDVWISQRYATPVADDRVAVTGTRVGLRSRPVPAQDIIVALASTPQELIRFAEQAGWFHVSLPADFTFWVRADAWQAYNVSISERETAMETAAKMAAVDAMQQVANRPAIPSSRFDPNYSSSVILTEDSVKVPMITLYLQPTENATVLGRIQDDADIISIRRRGEWSKIMLSTGVPAWIRAEDVNVLDSSLVKVSAESADLRIRPEYADQYVIGSAKQRETLQVLESYPGWYQVNTPADFQAWIKTAELDNALQ